MHRDDLFERYTQVAREQHERLVQMLKDQDLAEGGWALVWGREATVNGRGVPQSLGSGAKLLVPRPKGGDNGKLD